MFEDMGGKKESIVLYYQDVKMRFYCSLQRKISNIFAPNHCFLLGSFRPGRTGPSGDGHYKVHKSYDRISLSDGIVLVS